MGEPGVSTDPPPGHGPYLRRATLDGGFRVAVRGLRDSDRAQLEENFGHLSERTRFRRFLSPKSDLAPRELDLLFRPGPLESIVLVLVWPRTSRDDVLLGVAQAILLPGSSDTADVAVTVTDEIQGRGAGRLLIRTLAELALPRGITRFTACVLPSNTPSARMLLGAGHPEEDRTSGGVREITVRIAGTSEA